MVQDGTSRIGSKISRFKTQYSVAIGANLIIAIGHMAYAFVEYDTLNEFTLWFFSGALAIIFNAALNTLCLKVFNRLTHSIAMVANLVLLMFSVVLVLVVTEVQTVGFAVVVLYTTFVCINIRMPQKEF